MSRRATAVQLPRNSFVGRADDLTAVTGLLERERWVTLVGPAGSGKTRLALELAAVDSRSPGGRRARARRGRQGRQRGREGDRARHRQHGRPGVGLRSRAARPALPAGPRQRDRVLDEVRGLLGRLLALAGPLTVLVTSRSPLGGSDEVVYPLAPLPVDASADSAAVRLFVDRATAAAPSRPVDAGDVDLVASVCRRLDGLPLAIELAAARIRHLQLPELASRLEAGFDALDRAEPESRHRTLATAFDWTWDLLDDEERTVLSRLAALPRTFDLDLAEAVTGAGHRPGGAPSAGPLARVPDRAAQRPAALPAAAVAARLRPGADRPRRGARGTPGCTPRTSRTSPTICTTGRARTTAGRRPPRRPDCALRRTRPSPGRSSTTRRSR